MARERRESQHGGDPVMMNPRMECEDCGEFVYATRPRLTDEGFWYLECGCIALRPDDPEPEEWSRAY